MSFAFKEELNELVISRRCCSAANLWVLTPTAPISAVNYCGANISHVPWLKYWWARTPRGPMKSAPLTMSAVCVRCTEAIDGVSSV